MEKLIYRKFKGLEIRCLKCGKTIHKDPSPFNGCKHPIEKTAYRAIIIQPNSNGKRVTVTLKARSYDEAIKELIDYRTDVYNGINKDTIIKQKANPQLLIDCMAMYIDYLSDIDVPEHKKKHNSQGYIASKNSFFQNFIKFLIEHGWNMENFRINDINEKVISDYYSYLKEKTKSNYTFNHNVKAMRALMEFLITEMHYQIINHFKEIRLKSEKSTNISISSKDFNDLLSKITPYDSIQIDGKENRRDMYKTWLIDAIKLKAFTGRRNEEIFIMKWSNIIYENGLPIYMISPNIKINRLRNNLSPEDFEITYIPIIKELEIFLQEKGMKQNSDEYIIAPNEVNRKTITEHASKAFTFFFKKLSRSYHLEMGSLRSTYITSQDIYSRRQGQKIQQHTNSRITEKHYINDMVIAEFITKDRSKNRFKVFE